MHGCMGVDMGGTCKMVQFVEPSHLITKGVACQGSLGRKPYMWGIRIRYMS
jgi:hypothetical protein